MRPTTKKWASDFAKKLEAVIDDWNRACGESGECARAAEHQRDLIEFVLKRVIALEAVMDSRDESKQAAMDAYLEGSKYAKEGLEDGPGKE